MEDFEIDLKNVGVGITPPIDFDHFDQVDESLRMFSLTFDEFVKNVYGNSDDPIVIELSHNSPFYITIKRSNGFYRYYAKYRGLSHLAKGDLSVFKFIYGRDYKDLVSFQRALDPELFAPVIEAMSPTLALTNELLLKAGYTERLLSDRTITSSVHFGFVYYNPFSAVEGEATAPHKHPFHHGGDGCIQMSEGTTFVNISPDPDKVWYLQQDRGQNYFMDGRKQLFHGPVIGSKARSAFLYDVPGSARNEFIENLLAQINARDLSLPGL